MKTAFYAFSLLVLAAAPVRAQTAVVQFGPTTEYSTLVCANFVRLPTGDWKAINPAPFSLGFVRDVVPPARPIRSGGYVYNNIDLYSQLNAQCGAAAVVTARY